jgi:hypothetical protein
MLRGGQKALPTWRFTHAADNRETWTLVSSPVVALVTSTKPLILIIP